MEATNYAGIDYGRGITNIDTKTGIRYGVIPINSEACQAICDSLVPDYGPPTCPKCQGQADEPSAFQEIRAALGETFADLFSDSDLPAGYTEEEHECWDYVCVNCQHFFGSESAFGDEPIAEEYEGEGYRLSKTGNDSDVFVLSSPFYTHAQFCSPCAPGAGYLLNPCADGPKTYCLGKEWFDNESAPYPVFDVKTGMLTS